MRYWMAAAVVAALTAAPAATFAQDGGGEKVKDTTTYDFSGDDVTGNLVKPSGSNIQGNKHGKTSNLIDIRADFVDEMVTTVEDL